MILKTMIHKDRRRTIDVDYFGIDLKDIETGWLAVDEWGDLRWHSLFPHPQPVPDEHKHGYWDSDGDIEYLGIVDFQGVNWVDTRMEVIG